MSSQARDKSVQGWRQEPENREEEGREKDLLGQILKAQIWKEL